MLCSGLQKQQKVFNKKVEAAKKDCRKWDKIVASTHSHLAYHPDNIITIQHNIHTQFYQWIAGTQAACIPAMFLKFVALFYYDRYSEIAIRLEPLKMLEKTSPHTSEDSGKGKQNVGSKEG